MPHLIVKLWTGKTEQQKQDLTERLTRAVTDAVGYGDESVSICLEEIAPDDWAEQVYRTDVLAPSGQLYKKPGYTM